MNDLYKGLIIYAIVAIGFSCLYVYRVFTQFDLQKLQTPLSTIHIHKYRIIINMWSISHFLMYLVLGVVSPSYWLLWVCVGVLWEIIEFICDYYKIQYIDYKWSDIPINIGGLIMGVFIHDRILSYFNKK